MQDDLLQELWRDLARGRSSIARTIAEDAQSKVRDVKYDVRALSDRLDRLALISQTMWELLREHTNLTNEQIIDKMEEIDLRDGIADGKIGPAAFVCENCGHKVSSANRNCIYCGQTPPGSESVESI